MRILLLSLIILLSGCAAHYDAGEYGKVVDAAAVLNDDLCTGDQKKLVDAVDSFRNKIYWLSLYTYGVPSNQDSNKILNGISDEAERFATQISFKGWVLANEQFYCKAKIDGIEHGMKILIKAEGNKAS